MVAVPESSEFDGLGDADLSSWFNPFLCQFARDTRRCGGEVRVIRAGLAIAALNVSDPVERIGSVFTRSQAIAEQFVRDRGANGMYADFSCDPSAEPFDIFSIDIAADRGSHRFRNFVRPFVRADLPSVTELLREVHGVVNERWFEGLPTASEAGFLAEVDGRLAGVAWVSNAGQDARLHSLTVRAPYRRIGIGTDLLSARLLWAQKSGVSRAISEISRRNLASRSIALRAGMHPVGEVFFHRPAQ